MWGCLLGDACLGHIRTGSCDLRVATNRTTTGTVWAGLGWHWTNCSMVITAGRVVAGVRRRHEVVDWAFILVVRLTVFEDGPSSSHFICMRPCLSQVHASDIQSLASSPVGGYS